MNKNYGISAPTGVRSEAELKRLQAMLRPRAATGVWSQEDQSAYDAYLKKEAADPLSYRVYGYEPPAMVSNRARVESMQDILGVKVDGLWGPQTQAAYDARRQEEAALRTQQARGERGLVPLQGGVGDGYVSSVPDGPMIPNRVYAERDKAAALARQYRGTLGSTTLQGGIDDNYVSAVQDGPVTPNRVKAGDTPTLVEKVYQGLLEVTKQKSGEAGRMAMNEGRTEREEKRYAPVANENGISEADQQEELKAKFKKFTPIERYRNRRVFGENSSGMLVESRPIISGSISAQESGQEGSTPIGRRHGLYRPSLPMLTEESETDWKNMLGAFQSGNKYHSDESQKRNYNLSGGNREVIDFLNSHMNNGKPLGRDEMYYLEKSFTLSRGIKGGVVGISMIFDQDKYCCYYYLGITAGVSAIPADNNWEFGIVKNVIDAKDYSGVFGSLYAGAFVNGKASAWGIPGDVETTSKYAQARFAGLSASGQYYIMFKDFNNDWAYDTIPYDLFNFFLAGLPSALLYPYQGTIAT